VEPSALNQVERAITDAFSAASMVGAQNVIIKRSKLKGVLHA
jgi:hypothetical protein